MNLAKFIGVNHTIYDKHVAFELLSFEELPLVVEEY
jgi:hypothetical protein